MVFAPKAPGNGVCRLLTTALRAAKVSTLHKKVRIFLLAPTMTVIMEGIRVVVLQNQPIKRESALQNDRGRSRLGTDLEQTATGRRGGSDGMNGERGPREGGPAGILPKSFQTLTYDVFFEAITWFLG